MWFGGVICHYLCKDSLIGKERMSQPVGGNKMLVDQVSINAVADVSISSSSIFKLGQVKEIPLNFDFSDTKKVMVNYIKLESCLSVGNEYTDPGIHHSFFIGFQLILKNGNLGVYPKSDWIKRSHLAALIGENLVTDLVIANVIALQNRLQELSSKVGA